MFVVRFKTVPLPFLILFALAACSPATTVSDLEGPTQWTATVNGVPLHYEIVDTVNMEGVPPGYDWPNYQVWDGSTCNVQFTAEYLQEVDEEELAGTLAFGVAYCGAQAELSEDWVNDPWGGFEDLPSYTDAWIELYLEQCGPLLSPLGWQRASDGECDVPELREVSS